MTKTEQKVYDYAQSVEWDFDKVRRYIYGINDDDWRELNGTGATQKTNYFIEKHKPKDWREGVEELKQWVSYKEGGDYNFLAITLPIDDYNRLRKLEIKQQIKKLKKELKGL